MEIKTKPKIFKGFHMWYSVDNGVILVEKKEHIEPLWELLCEEDEGWESYKHVIKIAPKEIDSISDLDDMCVNVGMLYINEVEKIQNKIPFIIYQNLWNG